MADILSPREVIDDYRQKFIDALHQSIQQNDVLSGGGLFQSVTAQVRVYGQTVSLEISLEDYWKYVEQGVNGTKVKLGSEFGFKSGGKPIPLASLKKFIANRGLTPKTMNIQKQREISAIKGKGKLSKKLKKALKTSRYDSMAWAIGKSIKRKGLKPTHFASEVMEGNLADQFQKALTQSVGRQIKVEIEKELP